MLLREKNGNMRSASVDVENGRFKVRGQGSRDKANPSRNHDVFCLGLYSDRCVLLPLGTEILYNPVSNTF